MKVLSTLGVVAGVGTALTREDLLFIIGVVITVLNIVLEYLKYRKDRDLKGEAEDVLGKAVP